MTRFPQEAHPEQSLLLRYIDGELPARKLRELERHMEACWDCRAEVEELKKTVAECVALYRKARFWRKRFPDATSIMGEAIFIRRIRPHRS